jgi:MYXO-CTERM domain-containing protein
VPEGQNPSIILCASVHANEQPAEKGVTVARVSVVRGNLQVAGTADAIAPAPTAELKTPELKDGTFLVPQGYRFSQSILECADASCSAAALLTSHVMRGKRDGQNGHSPGTHATDILLVDRTSLAVHKAHVVGNWPHAHLTRLNYGAGAGTSALGVLSAPLTGMKPTTLQVMPVDGEGRDLAAPAPEHRYPVAAFTNQGDIVARGLNNPQNQGRGFLSAVTQVQNPGAEGGFMAGITSFTLVPTPTFGNGQHSFSGLDLCFVPATWGAQYTKTAPGSTIPWDKAPVGPPPDPANPNAPVGASPNVLEEGVAPTGSYAKKAGESCAMHASAGMGSNAPSYLALFGLFAAGAARARRGTRRRDGMGPFRTSGGPSCK